MILNLLIFGAAARIVWAITKARLGIAPKQRRGRTLLELTAAAVGAWWLARRLDRQVAAQNALIPPGSEVQVHVRRPSRYPRG